MLSDRNAVRLTELLRDYFVDCRTIDPSSDGPGTLTVQELVEDLAGSTDAPLNGQIEELLDEMLGL